MTLELRAYRAPWWGGVNFLLRDGNATAEPMVMKVRDPTVVADPSFQLTAEQAQVLMDDLWASGFRPTEGTGSAGALAATERHLRDLQRLIFEQ